MNVKYNVPDIIKTCTSCHAPEKIGKWAAYLKDFLCIDCEEEKPEEKKNADDIRSAYTYLQGSSRFVTQSARRGARLLLSRYPISLISKRAGREVARTELESILHYGNL